MKIHLTLLPGDGIGQEVTAQAVKVLSAVAKRFGHSIETRTALIGGAALDAVGTPLPDETVRACEQSDAVLLGAIGGPQWDVNPPPLKPEKGLLGIRKALGNFANLRPAKIFSPLKEASTLKPEVIDGVDLLIVRELTGGIYFGEPRGFASIDVVGQSERGAHTGAPPQAGRSSQGDGSGAHTGAPLQTDCSSRGDAAGDGRGGPAWPPPQPTALDPARKVSRVEEASIGFNTEIYSVAEIDRIVHLAFELARTRRKKVCSVDKANVMESSQLWRRVATSIAAQYPDVSFTCMYVDNCSMQLVANPKQFDVIVTSNLFGDILSDEASMLTGSIGMLPSASLGGRVPLYEPVHGSAPDIAGKDLANPLAAILSVAMMFQYTLQCPQEARLIESAVESLLAQGYRTRDLLASSGKTPITCSEMGERVAKAVG